MTTQIIPAVMSGGAGSRLWPVSRRAMPKQLLKLTTHRSMLQETVARAFADETLHFTAPLILANADQIELIRTQLAEINAPAFAITAEPVGRNTAAVAAAAALIGERQFDDDPLILLMPADHHITDVAAFRHAVRAGVDAALDGHLVTLGITPTGPETGYGYIQRAEALGDRAFAVARFREKPDRQTAEHLLAEGGWFWNAGLFLFRASVAVAEMQRHCPDVINPVNRSLEEAKITEGVIYPHHDHFASADDLPFDIAVMERTTRAAVVPTECGWDDVGSFASLWQIGAKDDNEIVTSGDGRTTIIDSQRLYLRADGVKVAAIGVEDLIIVATPDAVLVAHRDDAQKVKMIVDRLKDEGLAELL